jgi:hypothetical protein
MPTFFGLVISIRVILAMHIKDHYDQTAPIDPFLQRVLSLFRRATRQIQDVQMIYVAQVWVRTRKRQPQFFDVRHGTYSDYENTAPILGCGAPNTLIRRARWACTAQS